MVWNGWGIPDWDTKSRKPTRFVREPAAAEQEIPQDILARRWTEPCPAPEWAYNGFVVPKEEKGKQRLVVDYCQLNEATLPEAHPLLFMEHMLTKSMQTSDRHYWGLE